MEKDKFEAELDLRLSELQSCQEKNGVDSCLKCEKIIGCEVRKKYVSSVYSSMNKGVEGDFEF